jgi:XTP/dITP diphosphohydrolase
MHTIVVATRNKGKLQEFRNLLKPLNGTILSLTDLLIEDEVDESGNSFAENARLKAIAYSRMTDHPVLADDSGLEVDSLGGRPGIHSARYAGPKASDEDRINKLLNEIEKVDSGRQARFVCALALAHNGALLLEADGECPGIITERPRGSNGFGYDPIFLLPGLNKTYSELTDVEKDQLSHRARAVDSLLRKLEKRQ